MLSLGMSMEFKNNFFFFLLQGSEISAEFYYRDLILAI